MLTHSNKPMFAARSCTVVMVFTTGANQAMLISQTLTPLYISPCFKLIKHWGKNTRLCPLWIGRICVCSMCGSC